MKNWTQVLVQIAIDGDCVWATQEHPFWIPNLGDWRSAVELEPGMILLGIDGRPHAIEAINRRATEEATYNLEIEGLHTYFVGAAGVLVHNARARGPSFMDTNKRLTEIYIVSDPKGAIVYVGQTIQGIDVRFNQHIGDGHPHWKNGYRIKPAASGNWTFYEASVWEQHYIDLNGGKAALENSKVALSDKSYARYKHLHNPC